MIIVYGGCRADEPGRPSPRLPFAAAEALFVRVRGLLQSLRPTMMIGALASGADVVFARAALAEGIELRVLLPVDRATFRAVSVVPYGEPWIAHYDRITSTAGVTVSEGRFDPEELTVDVQHNIAVLDEAERLASAEGRRVWVLGVRPHPDPAVPAVIDDLMQRAEDRGLLTVDFDPLPLLRTAFVAMPYGRKKDPRVNRYVDCDPSFHRVYRPLLEDFDLDWTRADLQTDSGIIHTAMLSDLANSDLVLADLCAINFNVAYELGIRHVFASRATVLIEPRMTSFKQTAKPFDVNVIRTHAFGRGPDGITDTEAEAAIRALRPVIATALAGGANDSPCHDWFDLSHIARPFRPRAAAPRYRVAGRTVRERVAATVRSADAAAMLQEAANLAREHEISSAARQACRIELASGLMNEGEYAHARRLLEQAKPEPGDPLHRTWLHKTVMVLRRLGENTHDSAEHLNLWNTAKRYLAAGEQAGYQDSETYGIWGGLIKRQLEKQRAGMEDAVAQSLFAEMEQKYRLGFELDPEYYTGVNAVMALRWNGRPKNEEFRRDFYELLTITRFLARQALTEDPSDFWAAVTLAELTLHDALEGGDASVDQAIRQYADAARTGRPDQIDSARFQLEFLRVCGDPADVIDRALLALQQAA